MNRNPKAGDIVRMYDKRAEHLVTDGGKQAVETPTGPVLRYWFTAVPAHAADPITGQIDAKKEKKYFTEAIPSIKTALFVPLDQLRLTATAKFSVQKTYTVVKMKDIA